MPCKRKAIFLDRDGVINRAVVRDGRPYPPASIQAFEFLPGVVQAAKVLKNGGFLLIVVTNQPDVRTGIQKKQVVEEMHSLVRLELQVDDIKVCFHVDSDQCTCRKPKPGMLLQAADEFQIDLQHSYMVGDRWRDIEAGKNAGCRTILIENNYKETLANNPDCKVPSLIEAVSYILLQKN
jgi:D-glycero-D-manno-heptose 1,7-bisphosphate phosphatase